MKLHLTVPLPPPLNRLLWLWNAAIIHRRRARVQGNGGSYTAEAWQALCARYDYRCLCCGEQTQLTPDHVLPLALGGRNDIQNIQPLCLPCNRRKGVRYIDYRETNEQATAHSPVTSKHE